MLSRCLYLLWFALLWAVLPAQAESQLNGSQNSQLTFSANHLQTESTPLTDEQLRPNEVGALIQSRFSGYIRHSEQLDSSNVCPPNSPPDISGHYTSNAQIEDQCRFYLRHTHSYRLSGWKETNALYIALNSQF